MTEASAITAVLGPTNTGKTHRAVERMLSHASGVIGLPLRLLAREVYDRITARIGESRVALVTGEEKRVPRRPDYWVCTVEAMPLEREVDFLAVDEVQLAAHHQRGHVFTERVLHARGRIETWFMGSDTMRPMLGELTPTARFVEHPRLSTLRFAGTQKLSRLPKRSAVVAFSTLQVYECAERLRALRGGSAVVLGALSPRTRNAQVAMYQAGEVEHLVATDAIGMGLNLDIGHVAFAGLRKFDGREARALEASEVAQIAGRAGRYLTDGTFGTLAPLELPPPVALAVESHRFPAVRRVRWRSVDLEMTSPDALLASLGQRPHKRALILSSDADDEVALALLAGTEEVRARARGAEAVTLLWEVCRIPDYKKLLAESHAALLLEIWRQLSGPRARIDPDWLAARVREADDSGGDIDTLMARIATIRTWTYVTHHGGWVDDEDDWRARTRAVEDRLSDALHERLVQRFVDKRTRRPALVPRAARSSAPRSSSGAAPPDPSHPFAALSGLRARLAPSSLDFEDAETSGEAWLEALVGADHDDLRLDPDGRIWFVRSGGAPPDEAVHVATLARGASLLLPEVRLAELADLGAGARARVQRRLQAFARDVVSELCAPLRALAGTELGAAARGVVWQLEQGLGTVAMRDVGEQVAMVATDERARFVDAGVEIGARVVYLPALLSAAAVAERGAVCRAWADPGFVPPTARQASVRVPRGAVARLHAACGYPQFGPRAVRADLVERIQRAAREAGVAGREALVPKVARWLACPVREAAEVIEAIADG